MKTFSRTLPFLAAAALLGLAGCSPQESTSNTPAGNAPSTETPTRETEAGPKLTGKVPVVIETSMGTIELELDADKAPISVNNFANYERKGFYDGTIFHRIIPTFMIQGGGFTEDLKEKPTEPPIENEAQNGLHNERGTVAMARTSEPNSATSQFFINVVDNTAKLDYPNPDGVGYAVFGKVTKGMEVVDKIKDVPTTTKELTQLHEGREISVPAEDVPTDPVIIKSVKVLAAPAGSGGAEGAGNSPAAGNAPATGNGPAGGEKGTAPK
jgi:cyclophilin family peptidyl-prolyl cis-trans isomerase